MSGRLTILADDRLRHAIRVGFKRAWPRSLCTDNLVDAIVQAVREMERQPAEEPEGAPHS